MNIKAIFVANFGQFQTFSTKKVQACFFAWFYLFIFIYDAWASVILGDVIYSVAFQAYCE